MDGTAYLHPKCCGYAVSKTIGTTHLVENESLLVRFSLELVGVVHEAFGVGCVVEFGRIRIHGERIVVVVVVAVLGVVLDVQPGLRAVRPERYANVARQRQADRGLDLHLGVEYPERREHDHGYEEPGTGAQVQQQRLAVLGRGEAQQTRLDPVHVRGHQAYHGYDFLLEVHLKIKTKNAVTAYRRTTAARPTRVTLTITMAQRACYAVDGLNQ